MAQKVVQKEVQKEVQKPMATMGNPNLPFWLKAFTGTIAGSFSETCTIIFDTAKVKMQISKGKYKGLLDCLYKTAKEEGILALWKGWVPGIQRQFVYATIRLGLYEPLKQLCTPKKSLHAPPLYSKIAAAMLGSCIGVCFSQPTDVVKVVMQAQARALPNQPKLYKGVTDCYRKIIQQDGIKGLYRGFGPNIIRQAIVSTCELVSYDAAKQFILSRKLMKDGFWTQIVCSCFSAVNTILFGSPADVIKTRMMSAKSGQGEVYKNVFDCIIKTIKNEGLRGFYKGGSAYFARTFSWSICMFLTLERVRKKASDIYFKQKY